MILLALDTATPVASVALFVDERVFSRDETVTTCSERLLAMIDEVFQEAGIRPAALGGVVCGAGPGSFTGLRIGLSTAKGLCLGLGCSLTLVSSLEALAARGQPGQRVLAGIDAFRGELYAGLFALDENALPRAVDEALAAFAVHPDALAAATRPAGSPAPSHFIGDAFRRYPGAIPPGAIDLASADETPGPRARELLRLGRARFDAGLLDDPRGAVPRYVRASAPEEARR